MNKKYALAVATTLLAAESVFAAPSGDKTVVTCGLTTCSEIPVTGVARIWKIRLERKRRMGVAPMCFTGAPIIRVLL